METLQNKAALITGAGRGIGRTIALTLARQGMKVGVNDIDPQAARAVCQEIQALGATAIDLPASVSDPDQVKEMVERVESELGPLWLLVNNAGVLTVGPTIEMPVEA